MSTLKLHITNWSPVLVKGAMWIISSMILAFLSKTEGLTPDKLDTWSWIDYLKLPAFVIAQGLGTAMAFMDQIIARRKEQLESEGKIAPAPNVEIKSQA